MPRAGATENQPYYHNEGLIFYHNEWNEWLRLVCIRTMMTRPVTTTKDFFYHNECTEWNEWLRLVG